MSKDYKRQNSSSGFKLRFYINNIFYHDLKFYLIIMTLIRKIKMIKPPF